MIKRTIEISQQALHLSMRHQQLVLTPPGYGSEAVGSVPCEDIGLVIVDHPGASYTHAALTQLLASGAVLIVCDEKHLPAGLLLPLSRHTEVVWRLDDQIALSKPRRKRLWQQIVCAKIRNQAENLPHEPDIKRRLHLLARTVKSGDPTNVEAQAARLYWLAWLDEQAGFQRRSDGGDIINILLNYGYAILRAAVARALTASGLHPALGLHHCNRSNPFCLADDFMEPLRPMVEGVVRSLIATKVQSLDRQAKAEILKLLAATVLLDGQTGPLLVQLQRSVASLSRCIQSLDTELQLIELQPAVKQS